MEPFVIAIIVLLIILVMIYMIRQSLNSQAQGKLSIQPMFGMCPSNWNKTPFASGQECTNPDATLYVDNCMNHILSDKTACTTPVSYNGIQYCSGMTFMKSNPSLYSGWCSKTGSHTPVLLSA